MIIAELEYSCQPSEASDCIHMPTRLMVWKVRQYRMIGAIWLEKKIRQGKFVVQRVPSRCTPPAGRALPSVAVSSLGPKMRLACARLHSPDA